jgi:hypothetical protein
MVLEHTIDMIMTLGVIISSSPRLKKRGNAETRGKKPTGRMNTTRNLSSCMIGSSPRVALNRLLEEVGRAKNFIFYEPGHPSTDS